MLQILVLFLLLLSSGCSIFQHKDFISIDSYPRGKEVKKEDKVLGMTPLFTRDRLSSNPVYLINQIEARPVEKCGMQWTDPLVKRIPLLQTLLPDFLTNFVANYTPLSIVKGGKYECTALVRKGFLDKIEDQKEIEQCRKYLIIPPPAGHSKVSFKISKKWIDSNYTPNKKACDSLIHPKVAKEYLEFLGLNHMSRYYGLKYMMYGLIARMGYRLKATHIVFLPRKEGNITPKIYDVHTRLQNEKDMEHPFLGPNERTSGFILDKIARGFRFIPNSMSLRFKMRRWLHLFPEETEMLYSRRITKVKLPPTIVLSNIEYPLESWGTNFRFSPSLSYKRWEQQYEIKYASAMMALKLFGHTPIGTFIGRIGGGVAYIDTAKMGGGYQKKQGMAVAQWGGEYYKFLGERAFIKIGFRRHEFNKHKIVDGNFHLKGYSELFIDYGFYFPEMNTKIRSFFYD